MKTLPVRPRPAASLIILRRAPGGPEVLIGRRLSGARFMPDVYVFPGGRVSPSDSRAWPAESSTALGALARHLRAALRETFEETGLLIGEAMTGAIPDADEVAAAYAARQLRPALHRLAYVGRAITPTTSTMRFNTCFFLADARHAHGEIAGSGELIDLHWRKLAATSEIRMANVSRYMLARAAGLLDGTTQTAPVLYRWVGGAARIGAER
ncbi:MAG: hypothetical protein EXQ92_02735 [Alphaproteobacteria bacterium]|nr:hypothetical protein [Alphaproteobacteria bacterium]